jgi:uncharacterized protein (DUF2126 family)
MGKHYPGESLPRWALDIIGRRDGTPLVRNAPPKYDGRPTLADARKMIEAIAAQLGVQADLSQPGFEDPWHYVHEEALVPVDVDPHKANLKDPEDRRRLARILDRGLALDVGYVLALEPSRHGPGWLAERWSFRRERLYLIPGDSPMGLRLPLRSITGRPAELPEEETYEGPQDPRREELKKPSKQASVTGRPREEDARLPERDQDAPLNLGIRTALCVEPRGGSLYVFLPPMPSAARFCEIVRAIDQVSASLDIPVIMEGYPPPKSFELSSFSVTPDPGVLEVNVPPTRTSREYVTMLEAVFEAAAHSGLISEKYQLDGRPAGSGGGNHITLGGPSPLSSPFVRRHDLVASLITFAQHHPSLSYLFTGLFVGPTSQAPRVDEARHDSLYELEIALAKLRERPAPGYTAYSPPWLGDALLRNLLVDVSGNTHRTEICLDKLFDPGSPHGRQGLIELRAFEMPPHVRMAVAQTALVRALVASFAREPYAPNGGKLVRWGQVLHDRFLLPTWLWKDFEEVLAYLDQSGVSLPRDAFWSLFELKCPIVGALQAYDVRLELRNAIEPWNVLGEETGASGTTRYVDSSMDRVEVRVEGMVPERHVVTVNGQTLPLRPTGMAGEFVGGVRFRAWAPPHSLHPHIGIHHPLRFDVLDTWGKRSTGACSYHVWHPMGRSYDEPPLTRFEASARRAQRFTLDSPMLYPAIGRPSPAHTDAPYTLDLRRFAIDHPMPEPKED